MKSARRSDRLPTRQCPRPPAAATCCRQPGAAPPSCRYRCWSARRGCCSSATSAWSGCPARSPTSSARPRATATSISRTPRRRCAASSSATRRSSPISRSRTACRSKCGPRRRSTRRAANSSSTSRRCGWRDWARSTSSLRGSRPASTPPGWFAAERKRALPPYPRAVGIVTSTRAAALSDLLTTLRRRWPALAVIIYPTAVQGAGAAAEIAGAIRIANERAEVDVLIVARGGGSIEDLWAFNEEVVAQAVHASALPVVSAVGHETDFTICDFVADVRAPTPTGAATLVAPDRHAALRDLARLAARWRRAQERMQETRMQRVDGLARRLVHPAARLAQQRRDAQALAQRLTRAMRQRARAPPDRARCARAPAGLAPASAAAAAGAARRGGGRAAAGAAGGAGARPRAARRTGAEPRRTSIRRRCSSAATRSSRRPMARSCTTRRRSPVGDQVGIDVCAGRARTRRSPR